MARNAHTFGKWLLDPTWAHACTQRETKGNNHTCSACEYPGKNRSEISHMHNHVHPGKDESKHAHMLAFVHKDEINKNDHAYV